MEHSLRIYMGILKGNDGFCPLFLQKDLVSYIHEIDSKPYRLFKYIDIDTPPLKKNRQ